jgi:hypothetical protein
MILEIYLDSHGRKAHCKSCGAAIEWAELKSGKKMPFDWPIVVTQTEGSPIKDGTRVIERVDSTISQSHFVTCPDAQQWRREHGRRRR